MIEFFCQGDSELLIIKRDGLLDCPVMNSHHSQNEWVDISAWYAYVLLAHFVPINLQQVRKKRFSNGSIGTVWIHYTHIWNTVFSTYWLPQLMPHYSVIFFSHVVFLILVNGVAAITLAGYGVAFYLWGAL
ncbi:hypothetical protein [Halomonas citrativorans]|uniref:Uncharacterized protein n=1 Tax=Halomonas citrativorans TaxID=2742612 RepID=A0ABR9FBJ0_9GAMM|nr:hypothetical protein [Halomonas citrativorans]MBE0403087.1 hypothetical protein [Halomonas citrativorans]